MMYMMCMKLSKYVDTINVLNNYTALSALMTGLIIGLFFFLYNLKDIHLYFLLLHFVRKSILYAKITLSQKKFVSILSCKQTARLLFS